MVDGWVDGWAIMLGYVSVNQWQQPGVAPSAEAVAAAYERALDVKLARAQLLFAAQGLGVGLGTHGVLGAAGHVGDHHGAN